MARFVVDHFKHLILLFNRTNLLWILGLTQNFLFLLADEFSFDSNNLTDQLSQHAQLLMNDQISNKVFFLQALLCAIELEHSLENWPPDIQELKTSVRVDVRSEERQFTFVLSR